MYTLCIANQKGGVGKTTVAVFLASGLAINGRRVLLIDLDAQGNASSWAVPDRPDDEIDLADALLNDDIKLEDIIRSSPLGFDVAPSSQYMTEVPVAFARRPENDRGLPVLRQHLERMSRLRSDEPYDYVLIDCPPAMGSLVLGALTASDGVLIPIQVEAMSIQGLDTFQDAVEQVRSSGANPDLELVGVLANNLDIRRNQTKNGLKHLEEYLGEDLLDTRIRQRTDVSEASAFSESIFEFDSDSYSARVFGQLTDEVIARIENESR